MRVGETLELVSWGSRREFDHSELQMERRLFEACGPFALDKAQFPGSKENKHIKIKKKKGHQASWTSKFTRYS